MRWPWVKTSSEEQPDPEKARRDLARLRSQRVEVERLVHALRSDRERNHYGQAVEAIFKGGRP